jgi:hypothetical protein
MTYACGELLHYPLSGEKREKTNKTAHPSVQKDMTNKTTPSEAKRGNYQGSVLYE